MQKYFLVVLIFLFTSVFFSCNNHNEDIKGNTVNETATTYEELLLIADGSSKFNITLNGDTFKNIEINDDVTNWFVNLPQSIKDIKISQIASDFKDVEVSASSGYGEGDYFSECKTIGLVIPSQKLVSGNEIVIDGFATIALSKPSDSVALSISGENISAIKDESLSEQIEFIIDIDGDFIKSDFTKSELEDYIGSFLYAVKCDEEYEIKEYSQLKNAIEEENAFSLGFLGFDVKLKDDIKKGDSSFSILVSGKPTRTLAQGLFKVCVVLSGSQNEFPFLCNSYSTEKESDMLVKMSDLTVTVNEAVKPKIIFSPQEMVLIRGKEYGLVDEDAENFIDVTLENAELILDESGNPQGDIKIKLSDFVLTFMSYKSFYKNDFTHFKICVVVPFEEIEEETTVIVTISPSANTSGTELQGTFKVKIITKE